MFEFVVALGMEGWVGVMFLQFRMLGCTALTTMWSLARISRDPQWFQGLWVTSALSPDEWLRTRAGISQWWLELVLCTYIATGASFRYLCSGREQMYIHTHSGRARKSNNGQSQF